MLLRAQKGHKNVRQFIRYFVLLLNPVEATCTTSGPRKCWGRTIIILRGVREPWGKKEQVVFAIQVLWWTQKSIVQAIVQQKNSKSEKKDRSPENCPISH